MIAAFAPVFYAEFENGVLCVARSGVEQGPITLATAASHSVDWRSIGIAAGQPVIAGDGIVAIPRRLEISLAPARKLAPPSFPSDPDEAAAARGLDRIHKGISKDLGGVGLAGYLEEGHRPAKGNLAARAAAETIADAGEWLSALFSGRSTHSGWALRLVGLGPGLTPSGDDFLGGLMIGLHAVGRQESCRRLWEAIASRARKATGPISYALLDAAARGCGSASLHAALESILSGGDPAGPVARLARLGHSSGLDALAGSAAVLQRWARRPGRSAN